jgi:hypothetical protein
MSNTREPNQANPVSFKSKFDENNICSHESWQVTVLSREYGDTYLGVEGVTKENEIFANYYKLRMTPAFKEIDTGSLDELKDEFKYISFTFDYENIQALIKLIDEKAIKFAGSNRHSNTEKTMTNIAMANSPFFTEYLPERNQSRQTTKSYSFIRHILSELIPDIDESLPTGRHSFLLVAAKNVNAPEKSNSR